MFVEEFKVPCELLESDYNDRVTIVAQVGIFDLCL